MNQQISPKLWVAMTTGFGMALATALRWPALRIGVVGGLALVWLAGALPASAADPACCAVTSIAKSGPITAKETRGARTFQFQVADPALRSKLRVGAPVYANFATKQVSLDGKKPCCTILKISTAAKQPAPGTFYAQPRGGRVATLSPQELGVAQAFRAALRNPAVQTAARGEILSQMRSKRPVAFVQGSWVTLIDMSRVYSNATVRAAMLPSLRSKVLAGQLGNLPASNANIRVAFAVIPNQFGADILGNHLGKFRASLGSGSASELLALNATDNAILVAFGVGVVASLAAAVIYDFATGPDGPVDGHTGLEIDDPNADPDGDGTPNRLDSDDDGDGVPDEEDNYPYDPNASICMDCGGMRIALFSTTSADVMTTSVLNAYQAVAQRQASQVVSLGATGAATIGVQFPPSVR